jgi:adenylate cyclase
MFILSYSEHNVDKHHTLAEGETSVGRSPNCGLTIDDPGISRRHAVFVADGNGCRLRDLGSRNGTYRNGDLVTETEIADGDTFMLGHLAVRITSSRDDQLSLSDEDLHLSGETIYLSVRDTSGEGGARVESTRSLQLLAEIARTLVDVEDLDDVLGKVAELVFTAVPAERCFLLLKRGADPASDLETRVLRCRDGSTPTHASLSRTIFAKVMDERVAMLAANAQTDARLAGSDSIMIMAEDFRSFICTPLWNERSVIGVLYVDAPRAARFVEADLELLTALANYAAVAIDRARLTARVEQERQQRARLERYHSPGVVERILEAGDEGGAAFIAQEREVSVLFADVVGFTTWSEGLSPNIVAQRLNQWLACMADAIFEQDGTLDKFLGDAVLAVFGAPLDQPDHALRAVRAAEAIRRGVAALNAADSEPSLEVRIAINTGVAMTGDVGTPTRREYTVLGDVVNTAARIQSEVADPGEIVLTRATYEHVRAEVDATPLAPVTVRGRLAPVEVCRLA